MRLALFLAAAVAALFFLGGPPAHAQDMSQKCQGLRSTDFTGLPDAMTFVLTAEVVAAGNGLPEHCRITGTILPAIGFEMYMPTQGWNGRFLVQGCGGFCGSVPTAATRDALARNYAVTASDLGHRGGSPIDGKWGYNNRAAEVDFAFRATHVNAVAGKALVRTYYGRPANKNYFRGCSTGGHRLPERGPGHGGAEALWRAEGFAGHPALPRRPDAGVGDQLDQQHHCRAGAAVDLSAVWW